MYQVIQDSRVWLKKIPIKYYVVFLTVIMIAVGTGPIVRAISSHGTRFSSAFDSIPAQMQTSELRIVGELGTQTLDERQKIEVIQKIADTIGLKDCIDIKSDKRDDVTEVCLNKQGKYSDTKIKLISVQQKAKKHIKIANQYIVVQLQLSDYYHDIIAYKELIAKTLQKAGVANLESEVQYTCKHSGKMTLKEKNQLTNQLIKQLGGKTKFENRVEDMYTVYAYTASLKDYIMTGKKRVNLQIAMNYNEQTDETMIYLGSPILNGSY